MISNYWERQLSRRRVLQGSAAGLGLAALTLAGCGGSSSNGSSSDNTGLITKVEDSSIRAKPGGTWLSYVISEPATLDPLSAASNSALAAFGYSRFFMYRPGLKGENPTGEVDPDAAESYELTPDGLQMTIKLRGNLKLDARPPTNGRLMTSEDVKWSWDRWSSVSASRGELLNSVSPSSPIQSLQVIDAKTLVFKLAFPMANMPGRLAYHRYLQLLPVEADGKFDAKIDMRGTGPWLLTKYEPSVGFEYRKNPTWHIPGRPYLDGIQSPILKEYAQRLAQLKTGAIWTADVRAEDVVQTKRDQPGLAMYTSPFPIDRPILIGFSQVEGSPFLDARVRRALSMLIDRDTFIDVFNNVSGFHKSGLDVETRWHSHFAAGEPPYWIDPKGKGLGEGAAYFQHNVAEAMKLVKAAGYDKAISLPMNYQTPDRDRQAQVYQEMMQEGGLFNFQLRPLNMNDWVPQIHTGKGQYSGIGLDLAAGASGDIDQYLSTRFNVGTANFNMFTKPIPGIQELVLQQRTELDNKKRLDLLTQLQKLMASEMPAIPWPGAAGGYDVAWPYMGNVDAFIPKGGTTGQSNATEIWTHYWYDESKKKA